MGNPQALGGRPGAQLSLLERPLDALKFPRPLDGRAAQLGPLFSGPLQALGLTLGQLRPAALVILRDHLQNLLSQAVICTEGADLLLIFR